MLGPKRFKENYDKKHTYNYKKKEKFAISKNPYEEVDLGKCNALRRNCFDQQK